MTPTPTETPTPRTDKACEFIIVGIKPVVKRSSLVPVDFARTLERELAASQAQVAALRESLEKREEYETKINTSHRLFDLVRFMRSELHEAELITDDEYSWLCSECPMNHSDKPGSTSRMRLEEYDEMRARLQALTSTPPTTPTTKPQ